MGTLRVALHQGVKPSRYAFGTAAALAVLDRDTFDTNQPVQKWLDPLWQAASPDKKEKEQVLDLIEEGRNRLKRWRDSRFRDMEGLIPEEGHP